MTYETMLKGVSRTGWGRTFFHRRPAATVQHVSVSVHDDPARDIELLLITEPEPHQSFPYGFMGSPDPNRYRIDLPARSISGLPALGEVLISAGGGQSPTALRVELAGQLRDIRLKMFEEASEAEIIQACRTGLDSLIAVLEEPEMEARLS